MAYCNPASSPDDPDSKYSERASAFPHEQPPPNDPPVDHDHSGPGNCSSTPATSVPDGGDQTTGDDDLDHFAHDLQVVFTSTARTRLLQRLNATDDPPDIVHVVKEVAIYARRYVYGLYSDEIVPQATLETTTELYELMEAVSNERLLQDGNAYVPAVDAKSPIVMAHAMQAVCGILTELAVERTHGALLPDDTSRQIMLAYKLDQLGDVLMAEYRVKRAKAVFAGLGRGWAGGPVVLEDRIVEFEDAVGRFVRNDEVGNSQGSSIGVTKREPCDCCSIMPPPSQDAENHTFTHSRGDCSPPRALLQANTSAPDQHRPSIDHSITRVYSEPLPPNHHGATDAVRLKKVLPAFLTPSSFTSNRQRPSYKHRSQTAPVPNVPTLHAGPPRPGVSPAQSRFMLAKRNSDPAARTRPSMHVSRTAPTYTYLKVAGTSMYNRIDALEGEIKALRETITRMSKANNGMALDAIEGAGALAIGKSEGVVVEQGKGAGGAEEIGAMAKSREAAVQVARDDTGSPPMCDRQALEAFPLFEQRGRSQERAWLDTV